MQHGHKDFQSSNNILLGCFLIIVRTEGSRLYLWAGLHLNMFSQRMDRKMLTDALTLEEISIPARSEFFGQDYMQNALPQRREDSRPLDSYLFIKVQTVLKDATEFAYGRDLYYQPALNQEVMDFASLHSSSFRRGSMTYDIDDRDDNMVTDSGSDSSSSLKLAGLVVCDAFWNVLRLY